MAPKTQVRDALIKEWAETVVDQKLTRRQAIQDLLDHSKGDKMSLPDKAICTRALTLIDEGVINDHPPVAPVDPLSLGLPAPDGLDGPEQVEVE